MTTGFRRGAWLAIAGLFMMGVTPTFGVSTVEGPETLVPGEPFTLTFPELTPTRQGKPAQLRARLPKNYDPHHPLPLFVWLAGGEGGLNLRMDVVDPERFVLVALPYPQGAANPNQASMVGDFPTIWKYHATMLDALQQRVPNLSPLLRVLGGFSNGAHAIDGFLTLRAGEIAPIAFAFNVFVMADGGMAFGDYGAIRGKHLFVCWGEKGRTNKQRSGMVVDKARAAGVHVEAVPMEEIGHAFPKMYAQRAGAWITEAVIPDLMLEMNDRLRRMKSLGHTAQIRQLMPHLNMLTHDPVRLALWRRIAGLEP